MKTMETKLREEVLQLKETIKRASERLAVAPKGRLRISQKSSGTEYYFSPFSELCV